MTTALRDLNAQIQDAIRCGVQVRILLFELDDRLHAVPFVPGRQDHHDLRVDLGDGETAPYRVWGHVSGSTIDDLTLSPSFLAYEPLPDGGRRELCHGFVRSGRWEPCR